MNEIQIHEDFRRVAHRLLPLLWEFYVAYDAYRSAYKEGLDRGSHLDRINAARDALGSFVRVHHELWSDAPLYRGMAERVAAHAIGATCDRLSPSRTSFEDLREAVAVALAFELGCYSLRGEP